MNKRCRHLNDPRFANEFHADCIPSSILILSGVRFAQLYPLIGFIDLGNTIIFERDENFPILVVGAKIGSASDHQFAALLHFDRSRAKLEVNSKLLLNFVDKETVGADSSSGSPIIGASFSFHALRRTRCNSR